MLLLKQPAWRLSAAKARQLPVEGFSWHSCRFVRQPTCRRLHSQAARAQQNDKFQQDEPELDRSERRKLENELRDPSNFVEYFLPRPLRLVFFGASAASCLIAALLALARSLQEGSEGGLSNATLNAGINFVGLVVFAALFWNDSRSAEQRVQRRRRLREAQIKFGDRTVFYNDQGEKLSRLKEVDDDWVLRRLERWGKRDNMPFLGPKKGAMLQALIAQHRPQCVVEVGTMCGYSAILIAQALSRGAKLITIEKDWKWVLVAKRFLWQASQGSNAKSTAQPSIASKVDVKWGDACDVLRGLPEDAKIDMLFLDGLPKEYLEYLKAAEPRLARGAILVADNAGVFAEGGLKNYLEYVRNNPQYTSEFKESTLGWRDDVMDGFEVSRYQ